MEKLRQFLSEVSKPARYTNGELNSCHKDWDFISVKMALAFPDVYEIGMANLGYKILYHIINQRTESLAERVYLPWPDMQAVMAKEQIPLFALESGRPLTDFDVIGFTLQYELSYSNIVKMLDLANIPRYSTQRQDEPLIIAGGPCAFNPEPIADFLDCIVLGDGEEIIGELLAKIDETKKKGLNRFDTLLALAQIPGVYVPSFYQVNYSTDGIESIKPLHPQIPAKITKRVVADLNKAVFPDQMIVPYLETVHDRAMVEVMRGCTRGCRFCQAGMIYRPVRERDPNKLIKQAKDILDATGYDEVSLTSLSTGDYSSVEQIVTELVDECSLRGVAVSLPSLRVDSFSVKLATEIQKFKKTGLTFAPEAGTQRLRDVINKNVRESDLYDAVTGAFAAGWHQIKLYFMIGLPTETEADLDGIVTLAKNVLAIGRHVLPKGSKRPTVNISVSSFVPKSHTPFQWDAFNEQKVLIEKQNYLRTRLRQAGISFQAHDVKTSFLEAIFARGDRRLAPVIARAVDLGCQFDGWTEHFNFSKWMEAFRELDVDGEFYAYSEGDKTKIYPWDHLSSGVSQKFLWLERERAYRGITTDDCRYVDCTGCRVCQDLGVDNLLYGGAENG